MKNAMRLRPLLILAICFAGCGNKPASKPVGPGATEIGTVPGTSSSSAAGNETTSGRRVLGSLPDFALTDQLDTPFGRDDLVGRVAIINFIFTACPGTCLQQSQWMSEIAKRLADQPTKDGIRLVSITVDPENDTPEVLSRYAGRYQADPNQWKFLTGPKEAIWQFSQEGLKLPVALNPSDPLIPIAHDSKFVLIDRKGRIRGYFDVIADNGVDRLWKAIDFILPEFQPEPAAWPRVSDDESITHLAQPPEVLQSGWLAALAEIERDALARTEVRRNFRFSDRRQESGITFSPQIVDDQRHLLHVNHYDHGNSISVADVDGDGLLDIYFVSQVGPNELWRNLGGGKFENITETAGVGAADRICIAASFADTDNDGDPDLFVTAIRGGNRFFVNEGSGRYRDATAESGLGHVGHSSTGTFFDYDNDGLLDLFVTNIGKFTTEEYVEVRRDLCNTQPDTRISYYVGRKDAFAGHLRDEFTEPSILYRNTGNNVFEDVTQASKLVDTSWSGDAIPMDVNHDGRLDLYVLSMQGSDHLWVNVDGKTFEDQTTHFFPKTPWGAMGAQVFDFDGDGLLDLMLTDMHSDMSEDVGPDREKLKSRMQWPADFLRTPESSIFGNALYRQKAPGVFEEISDQVNAENYWPWGVSAGDLNADGRPDMFIASSMCFPYRYGVNSLLLNDGGKTFVDAQFSLGVEPRSADRMLAPWFSLTCEGPDAGHPMCKGRSGTVVVWSARGTRSSALFDLDGDGDLDIVTNEFNTPPQVLMSDLAEQGDVHWLSVRLEGAASNRDGVGAVVTVTASGRSQTQFHSGKSGYLSQSCLPLYFGLGTATAIDQIEVRWPTGETQTVSGPIEAHRELVIRQADSAAN